MASGQSADPANRLGVLIDDEHFGKVSTAIETAKKEGMTPVIGGDSPTARASAPPSLIMSILHLPLPGRSFRPVLAVMPVRSADQALQLASDTHYGLAASCFRNPSACGQRASRDSHRQLLRRR